MIAWRVAIAVLPSTMWAQIPGRADPFLIIDRIREPVAIFLDVQGPLGNLLPPVIYSGSVAAGGLGPNQ